MGTLGYVAGGPKIWIAKANNFLPNNKKKIYFPYCAILAVSI